MLKMQSNTWMVAGLMAKRYKLNLCCLFVKDDEVLHDLAEMQDEDLHHVSGNLIAVLTEDRIPDQGGDHDLYQGVISDADEDQYPVVAQGRDLLSDEGDKCRNHHLYRKEEDSVDPVPAHET